MNNNDDEIEVLDFDDEEKEENLTNINDIGVIDTNVDTINEVIEPVEFNNSDSIIEPNYNNQENIVTDVENVSNIEKVSPTIESVNTVYNTSAKVEIKSDNIPVGVNGSRLELPTDAFGYDKKDKNKDKVENKNDDVNKSQQSKNGGSFIIILLILALIGGGVYFYFNNKNKDKEDLTQTSDKKEEKTNKDDSLEDKTDNEDDSKKDDDKETDKLDLTKYETISDDTQLKIKYVVPDINGLKDSSQIIAGMYVYSLQFAFVDGKVSEMSNQQLINLTLLYLNQKRNDICYSEKYLNSKAKELFGVELNTNVLPTDIIFDNDRYCIGTKWGVGGSTSPIELINTTNSQENGIITYIYEYGYETSKTIVKLEYKLVDNHYVLESITKTNN